MSGTPSPTDFRCPSCGNPEWTEVTKDDNTWVECERCGWDSRKPSPPDVRYRWGNNPRRAELKGRVCKVIARGSKGSVLLLFPDTGEHVVSSWRAVS